MQQFAGAASNTAVFMVWGRFCSREPVITFVLNSIHLFSVSLKLKTKKLVQPVFIVYWDSLQVLWLVLICTFTVGWVFWDFSLIPSRIVCNFLCSRWWALQLTKEVQSCPRICWFSVRGYSYPWYTVPPPPNWKIKDKHFISFKMCTNWERAITCWNSVAQTHPVLDLSSFVPVPMLKHQNSLLSYIRERHYTVNVQCSVQYTLLLCYLMLVMSYCE
jgi:hypothetical protein